MTNNTTHVYLEQLPVSLMCLYFRKKEIPYFLVNKALPTTKQHECAEILIAHYFLGDFFRCYKVGQRFSEKAVHKAKQISVSIEFRDFA